MPKYWIKASEVVVYEAEIEADTWEEAHYNVIELIGQKPAKYEVDTHSFQLDEWCEMTNEETC